MSLLIFKSKPTTQSQNSFSNHPVVCGCKLTKLLNSAASSGSSSSALSAACDALHSGAADAAIVAGARLSSSPSSSLASSNSSSAEAFSAVYIKPLNKAIRDGNPIRAVIRAHAASNDTQQTEELTKSLIRDTYQAAGLDPQNTTLIEVNHRKLEISFGRV